MLKSKAYKPSFCSPFKTTAQEQEDRQEGILEQMLQSLESIGQNVERIVCQLDFYTRRAGRRNDDEWKPEDLYENGED